MEKQKQEEIEKNKRKEKKILRNIKIRLGYVKFDDWDKSYEKKLLKATRRGVVKVFNSIVEHRKKDIEMQKNEENEAKKKSNNFLMMHNLKYLNPDIEDEEENEAKIKEQKYKKKNKDNYNVIDVDDNEENGKMNEEEKVNEESEEEI